MAANQKDKQGAKEEAEEVKKLVVDLRKDVEAGFNRMLTWKLAQQASADPQYASAAVVPVSATSSTRGQSTVAMSGPRGRPRIINGFANEAKAASAVPPRQAVRLREKPISDKQPGQSSGKVYSMQLDLTGLVKATDLEAQKAARPHGISSGKARCRRTCQGDGKASDG